MDEQSDTIGTSFMAMTRDISPGGIGLVHTEPIDHGLLALQMSLAGEKVNLVAKVRWWRALGPYYYIGGEFVSRLDSFPS